MLQKTLIVITVVGLFVFSLSGCGAVGKMGDVVQQGLNTAASFGAPVPGGLQAHKITNAIDGAQATAEELRELEEELKAQEAAINSQNPTTPTLTAADETVMNQLDVPMAEYVTAKKEVLTEYSEEGVTDYTDADIAFAVAEKIAQN